MSMIIEDEHYYDNRYIIIDDILVFDDKKLVKKFNGKEETLKWDDIL